MTRQEALKILYKYQELYVRSLSFTKSGSFTDEEMAIFHRMDDLQEQIISAMSDTKEE